ncbi:MAG: energy transducer TonB [Xanthomonadaceae bacterium]|nr:energy transducer TonB [Xanthomonadaceae bacterium]
MASTRRVRSAGAISAVLGFAMVLGLMLVMNRQIGTQSRESGESGSQIEIVRKEKPPQPAPLRKPEPPKRPQRQAPTPLIGLDSALSGLDFGLPQFDASELDLGKGLLGDSSDVVMTDDSVDQAPRPIVQTPMTYPPRAKASGITGYVLLSVLISPTGQVERVKVLESEPAGVFDDVAMAGVQNWKFEPASYRGENVRVWARQRVRFDLSRG